MSKTVILFMVIGAGIFLSIAGVTFFLWQPPAELMQDIQLKAQYMNDRILANFVYVFSVVLSCLLFIPVLICLIIRGNKHYPNTIVAGGTIILLGFLFDMIANLYSLSFWGAAIPESIKGEQFGFVLFKSIESAFLALDFCAVALVYGGAFIFGIGFRKEFKSTSIPMLLSVVFFFMAIISGFYSRTFSIVFMVASFIVYGIGIIGTGLIAIKYES